MRRRLTTVGHSGWGRPWLLGSAVAVATALTGPSTAHAIEYSVFVEINDDDDLLELLNTDQIEEDTFNTLVELLRQGTDLDTASREQLYSLPNLTYDDVDAILQYRDEAGRIGDPANLVAAGALSRRKLSAIAPFVRVPPPAGAKVGVDGFVRYQIQYAPGDRVAPPMFVQARVQTLRHLTVGFAGALDRARVSNVGYDPARDALAADAPRPRVRFAKYFAQWDTEKWGVIAGTYRIGFGQRLVFDSTDRYTPNGFLLDHTVQRRYDLTRECSESAGELAEVQCDFNRRIAPDYAFRDGQQGIAAGIKKLELPTGHLQAYGWFSYQPKSLYQYRVRDKSQCPDPLDFSNPGCTAPPVYHRAEPVLAPRGSFRNETLPNMYLDVMGGANVSYFYDRRTHVGVTGFGAKPVWRVPGADLDFRHSDRTPWGGPYGAVGADFGWGHRFADLFGEVARSFDSMRNSSTQGGGGFAGILRNTLTFDDHEVEISARAYGVGYANPNAGSISAPDRYDGLTSRNEAGGRVRYNLSMDKLDLRTFVDFWGYIDPAIPKTKLFARGDYQVNRVFRPGLWLQYDRRDLAAKDRLICPGNLTANDLGLETCNRQRISAAARTRLDFTERYYLSLQYRHDFQSDYYETSSAAATVGGDSTIEVDDVTLEDIDLAALEEGITAPTGVDELRNQPRQDINAFMVVGASPIEPLRIRTRWRWLWDEIFDNGRWEHSLWGNLQVTYAIRRWAVPSIRYDVRMFLDSRDSTATRRNPEHWIRFDFMSRF